MKPMNRISTQELKSFSFKVMKKVGCTDQEARDVSDVLVEADMRGIYSHGVARLKRYVDHIASGVIEPGNEPEILFETNISLVYDGYNGVGQYISKLAMTNCIEKTRKSGVCFCSVKNSNHFGIAGYYAELASKNDFLGISMTNTAALVVPTFSSEPVLGTNPIAISLPIDTEKIFLLDMATSVVPRGKLEVYNRLNKKIPDGWAVDENGNSTNNPGSILTSLLEKKGGLLPLGGLGELFGGHKGYGLSLVIELLTAGLSLGNYSKDTYDGKGKICHFFAAVDLGIFGDRNQIKNKMKEIINAIVSSNKASGHEKIFYHGEKERMKRENSLKNGIVLDNETRFLLDELAEKFNLDKLNWEVCR